LALYFTISFFAELVWAYYYLPAETFVDLPPWNLVKSDLGIVIKLGAAGVASSCSDWWAWEALSFFAAWMGSDVLAAQGVLLTTYISRFSRSFPC
jgi:MATE family multidrug resistance protein